MRLYDIKITTPKYTIRIFKKMFHIQAERKVLESIYACIKSAEYNAVLGESVLVTNADVEVFCNLSDDLEKELMPLIEYLLSQYIPDKDYRSITKDMPDSQAPQRLFSKIETAEYLLSLEQGVFHIHAERPVLKSIYDCITCSKRDVVWAIGALVTEADRTIFEKLPSYLKGELMPLIEKILPPKQEPEFWGLASFGI